MNDSKDTTDVVDALRPFEKFARFAVEGFREFVGHGRGFEDSPGFYSSYDDSAFLIRPVPNQPGLTAGHFRKLLAALAALSNDTASLTKATQPRDDVVEEREDGRNYLIRKGGYWYRPDRSGYTANPYEAGRYTKDEAHKESHPNGPDGPRDEMEYFHVREVKWPALTTQPDKPNEVEALEHAVETFKLIAGKPEWDEEKDGPEPYNPRWSNYQCRQMARQALSRIDNLLERQSHD